MNRANLRMLLVWLLCVLAVVASRPIEKALQAITTPPQSLGAAVTPDLSILQLSRAP
ncbi:MAG: hypothetical protein ACYC5M_08295 [Anaerolineae bacterium]